MGELVADYFLTRLREWVVYRIYGYPGDGINAFLGALDRANGDPDFIQARHEEMAAFMACGHAKFAGPDALGVCMATSGPGAIHRLNGLYHAKLAQVPAVAIGGPRKLPQESDIQHAAEIRNDGEKVAMLVGQGARGAAEELERVADLLGAGVAKALLGKDVLADDLPYVTGAIGLLGTIPSYDMMEGCDTLLMVGTSFPYAEFLPKEGQARCVEIDIKADMIGMRYTADVQRLGDSQATL